MVELFWSSHASATAVAVAGDGQENGPLTVQVWVAGEGSVFPAGSVARTRRVWVPSVSPVYWRGEVQKVNADPSREHSNVAPVSSAVKVKVAVVSVVGSSGPVATVVWGAVVSTVQVYVAGVRSVFPAGSVART